MKRLHDLELGLGVDEVLAAGAYLHLHALGNGDHNDDKFEVEKILMTDDNDDDVHLSWVGDQGAVAGGAVPVEALEAVTRVASVALTPAWPQCAVTPAAE